ncbi:MAG: class I SAM-dependent methyltransferase [Vicinamibacterales bacterium]|nr:class I SAM-dependent methyltransferase [Vicinamibacterales bacterium]
MKRTTCMVCGSAPLETFLDLGAQPNGNAFPDSESKHHEVKYPLSMSVCPKCWLVQLDDFPPPEVLFTDHPYITGLNAPIVRHFNILSKHIVEKFEFEPQSLVIDIGANDGTFLDAYRRLNMRVLGVDPGQRTGRLARAAGVTVCETFWSRDTGSAIKALGLRPDLITATAVFYHVPDLHDFVAGLDQVMDDNTVFATQCVYIKRVLESVQFDHFYHEHTCIYSIRSLRDLFVRHGMRLLDVEFYDVHGGSFVLYVAREHSPKPTKDTVQIAIEREEQAGLFALDTYRQFSKRVENNARDLVALLRSLRAEKKVIYALGAPVKGSTLMNYCGIGPDLVTAAVEVNHFKIGRLTPGTHIPVIAESQVQRPPDYYLVLAWNFLDYFIQTHQDYLQAGGKFIVPNPEVGIVDAAGFTPWTT